MGDQFPKITHLGGEKCVTGSCHFLQAGGLNILVDCGLTQGEDQSVPMEHWPVAPREIDYIFLTHAHIDHIGRLPQLVQRGFEGEIICTHPTRALLGPMLGDAMGFCDLSAQEIMRLERAIDDLSWGFEYGETFDLKQGLTFKLARAGHILGSCFIRFESKNPLWSVIFSGDLGAANTPILTDPDSPEPCDLLILESTYGDRIHEGRRLRVKRLGRLLARAVSEGGKVFMPAFALGRTQELIYEMDRLFSDPLLEGEFPELHSRSPIPVIVDTPLGVKITKIYSRLSPYWDRESQRLYQRGDHPIDFDNLYTVRNYKDHLKILHMPGPMVIIAGSGMCTGGRIVNHLKAGLENPGNHVFFVGYQARNTPGAEIIKGSGKGNGFVYLDGEKVKIRATVHTLSGYSAHADQRGLVEWVQSMAERPVQVKLVHGEPAGQMVLKQKLQALGYNVI